MFLENYIHWHVRIYAVENNSVVLEKSPNKSNTQLFSNYCDTCSSSDDGPIFSTIENNYVVVLITGIISLLGNGTTIIHELMLFIRQKHKNNEKERNMFRILVVNLCFADALMGIYLTIGIILFKSDQINSSFCNALGVMSTLSIQASASILVIITACRLYGVYWPFKRIRIKFAITFLVLVWVTWFLVVLLPLFNESLFAHEFTWGVRVNSNEGERTIYLHKVLNTIHNLAEAIDSTDELLSEVLDTLSKYKSSEVALQVLKSFNLADFKNGETRFVEYYDIASACTLKSIVEARVAALYFSVLINLFNLLEFCFIVIAHLLIFKALSNFRLTKCFPRAKQKNAVNEQGTSKTNAENRQTYIRIFVVVLTNIMFGFPICVFAVLYNFGTIVFDCRLDRSFASWIVPIVILLFPLNSIINPYIYSFPFWKSLFIRGKRRLQKCR